MVFSSGDREIRVNFGVITGREVTAAEVDELARELTRGSTPSRSSPSSATSSPATSRPPCTRCKIEVEKPIDVELRGRLVEIVERGPTPARRSARCSSPTG